MRRLFGVAVLAVGFVGLGYVATNRHAERMQSAIQYSANEVSKAAALPLHVQVSGRDVSVSGRVYDRAALDQLMSDMTAIHGVRIVDLDTVEVLPVADPFEIQMSKTAAGAMAATGVVSSLVTQTHLGALASDLTLAAGAPDGWAQAAIVGLLALEALNFGEVSVSGTNVVLIGEVNSPTEHAVLLAALDDLPDGFTTDVQVAVLDDGTPLRLILDVADGVVTGDAKLPADLSGDAAFAKLDSVTSQLEFGDADWSDAARIVVDAAARLIVGQVQLEGSVLTVRGQTSPEGKEMIDASLETLSASITKDVQVELWDDGAPLQVTMNWDGETASADGKLPADFALVAPSGIAATWGGETSFRRDTIGAFSVNANAGVAALGILQNGTLVVTADLINLSGTAASPQVNADLDIFLANVSPDTEISRDITYLDDGSPASWALSYDAVLGATIEGRLPTTLSLKELQDALGGGDVTGTAGTAFEDTDAGPAIEVLGIIADYLPEIEHLSLSRDGGGTALDLVLSPGIDIDLIATDLAQRVPVDVAFTLGPLESWPELGTYRINAATGVGEVFRNGFWIPDLNFVTSIDGCLDQTLVQLGRNSIRFLSGSARLSATSVRAVNALAAIAVPCVEADLELEVVGHTDASGDADENQILSQARAAAVRDALIVRGVPQRAVTSIGFGATQPIADNETPEGRTENRRTEIKWFERGALRNP